MIKNLIPSGKKITVFLVALFAGIAVYTGCFISKKSVKGNEKSHVNEKLASIIAKAWLHLGNSEQRCGNYDYFPNGGMRAFYCHLVYFINYKDFTDLIGVPVFTKGPHSEHMLNLNSKNDFGHYNRDFVTGIREIMIPGSKDSSFRKVTQPVYERYIKNLARICYVTYKKIQNNPEFLNQEMKLYREWAHPQQVNDYDYERFFYFMNSGFLKGRDENYMMNHGFDGSWNGNVVKTCVAFWIRRSIDGTAEEFYHGLEELLKVYDGNFLE